MNKEFQNEYVNFGLNVVYYRKSKRLTQAQLAELVGVDRSHISAIELGNVGVSLDVIFKIAKVLDVDPARLLMSKTKDFGPFWL